MREILNEQLKCSSCNKTYRMTDEGLERLDCSDSAVYCPTVSRSKGTCQIILLRGCYMKIATVVGARPQFIKALQVLGR